jgi:hypothetical protein
MLTGFGPGGFGPPACLATIIWSTDRTVLAASVASLIAQLLEIMRSRIPSSFASRVPVPSSFYPRVSQVPSTVGIKHTSISTPVFQSLFLLCAVYNLLKTSVASSPALSAKVRGITSNASPYFLIEY